MMRRTYDHVRAVDGISFKVHPRQTLGLVGESGCVKRRPRAILRLVEPTGNGTIPTRPRVNCSIWRRFMALNCRP